LTAWAEAALLDWPRPEPLDDALPCVSIRLVNGAGSQALNKQWRGLDRPTNVLSFPAEVPGFLGDIVLCVPVIESEAREQQKSSQAHWAHLVVHGVLHLRGHDHETDHAAAIMAQKEVAVLKQLGFPNPYSGQ
jgi:probable rRNA maturation factor